MRSRHCVGIIPIREIQAMGIGMPRGLKIQGLDVKRFFKLFCESC
jgi:hypothetical protein